MQPLSSVGSVRWRHQSEANRPCGRQVRRDSTDVTPASDCCSSPGTLWPTSGACAGTDERNLQCEVLASVLSFARTLKGAYTGAACGARQAQPEQSGEATATRHLAAQTSPDGATEERRAEPQRPARVHLPKSEPCSERRLTAAGCGSESHRRERRIPRCHRHAPRRMGAGRATAALRC